MKKVTITITQKETITIVLSLEKNGLIHHILRELYHEITQTRWQILFMFFDSRIEYKLDSWR